MATLLLAAAGTALGGGGATFLGSLLGAAGGIAGAVVDNALIDVLAPRKASNNVTQIGITGGSEGVPVRKVWGRMRVAGNVIWCTRFRQSTEKVPGQGSGKGFGGSGQKQFTYAISFAVAVCEGGENVSLQRIWADGSELDQSKYVIRFHNGGAGQLPDSLIQSTEGVGATPAYRGIAYIVFDAMNLDAFGSRMPQITAEIIRYPDTYDADDLRACLRSVALLPGSGEFVLATRNTKTTDGQGNSRSENQHTSTGRTDLQLALDELGSAINPSAVSLVVTWFGTDLRAASCAIVPKVETSSKNTTPAPWSVNGISRGAAQVVSQVAPATLNPGTILTGAVPAFGGTPSDDAVRQAIAELKGRGIRVMFYPFVTMDIPPGNGLPDPYGSAQQAAFPWRGRITCFPAAGQPGSVDKTSAATAQVNAFFVQYSVMVVFYANLCVAAGGVDAFVIGSELIGLTSVRSSPGDGTYPAVQQLKSLAATVKAIVGAGCKVGYAADWSEYHSHRPADGSGDVIFNMDPLWSDPHIDFVGIDNYLPLSDWRDTLPNTDSDPVNGPFVPHDKKYLESNVEGGEDHAWYYATPAARAAQTRTAIADAAYGQPWVFRNKDIRNWWANPHRSRPGGVPNAAATGWVAQGKPIWFTELGCPAVDKGSNQPNVFFDPKSSESFFPYFSRGSKDDAIQRAALEATITYWRDNAPTSSVYGAPMLDVQNIFVWAWDARPYPDFPAKSAVWSDAANWEYGHWITGRLSYVPLKWIVLELATAVGVDADIDTSGLIGPTTLVPGYTIDTLLSPRDALAGLMDAFGFDAVESGGKLRFVTRAATHMTAIGSDSFVLDGDNGSVSSDLGFQVTRGQETDLPTAFRLSFVDIYNAYNAGAVEARKSIGNSQTVATLSTTAVLDQGQAKGLADSLLQQAWAARENGEVKLPPSLLALDPGDGVLLSVDSVTFAGRIKEIDTTTFRSVKFVGFDPSLATAPVYPPSPKRQPAPAAYGQSIVEFVELPLLIGTESAPWAPRVAATQSPWPGGVNVFRSVGSGWTLAATVLAPGVMGELASPLYSGPVDRWDLGNTVYVQFYGAAGLMSVPDSAVFAGANAVIVKNPASGDWEVVQFATATLLAPGKYSLTRLLRGQLGSEGAMASPVPAGARVIFLDTTTFGTLDMTVDQVGIAQALRYGPANLDQADPTYQATTLTPKGEGLRPYSVNDVRAARALPGRDVTFTWARRTRFGGDNFDLATVPLNEDVESYDLEVVGAGGAVVRSVGGLGAPTWVYTAAMQTADFGTPQRSYTVNIYQRSVLYGRGQVRTVTVFL